MTKFCSDACEIKYLRASNAALKAENEALKKERKQIIESEIDCGARSVAKDDEIEGLRQALAASRKEVEELRTKIEQENNRASRKIDGQYQRAEAAESQVAAPPDAGKAGEKP